MWCGLLVAPEDRVVINVPGGSATPRRKSLQAMPTYSTRPALPKSRESRMAASAQSMLSSPQRKALISVNRRTEPATNQAVLMQKGKCEWFSIELSSLHPPATPAMVKPANNLFELGISLCPRPITLASVSHRIRPPSVPATARNQTNPSLLLSLRPWHSAQFSLRKHKRCPL